MSHASKIELKAPGDFRPHPLKKLMPRAPEWQKGGAAFNAFCDDIAERGIVQPLLVTPAGEILEGELRWLAAKQLKLTDVPVIETNAAPAGVILGALVHRVHLTKSALAYVACPLMQPAFEENRRRRLENLRKGQCSPEGTRNVLSGVTTVEELAESLGVSRMTLLHARKLHEIFAKRSELRVQFEAKVLSGENGLGATLAGIGSADQMKGEKRPDRGQLRLWLDVLEDGFNRCRSWNDVKLDPEVWKTVDKRAADMPAAELESMIDFHSAMAARLRRAVKEGMTA